MPFQRDLLSFIRQHLTSVWALEILLLLRRDRDRLWTSTALVEELRASNAVVGGVLLDFERTGLIIREEDGSVRYAPAGTVLDGLCERIEAVYRERPVAVIKAISAPPDRLQALADAFRLKGDGK
jgi:hypothetical protein